MPIVDPFDSGSSGIVDPFETAKPKDKEETFRGLKQVSVPQVTPRSGFATQVAAAIGQGPIEQEAKVPKKLGEQYYQLLKGVPIGAVQGLVTGFGIPSLGESLVRSGARKLGSDVSPEPFLPTPERAGKYLFGEPKSEYEEAARGVGELLSPALPKALSITGKAVASPFKTGAEVLSSARGKGAREASETLRKTVRELAEEKKLGEEAKAASEQQRVEEIQNTERQILQRSQEELNKVKKAQEQIANRESIAAERAARQAGASPQAMQDIRESVLTKTRDRVQSEMVKAREAGLNESEAMSHLADTEGRVVAAEKAVQDIEQRILSGERMAPEQFGSMLSNAAKNLLEIGMKTRETLSGFGSAVRSAGESLIVPTQKISSRIDQIIKTVRDPAISKPLEEIKTLLSNGEGKEKILSLSVEQADSLRKMLNRISRTKQIQYANGSSGDAAAALHHINEIEDMVTKAAGNAHPPYKDAMDKFRRLSRPLDIVQRKGALRKVVDVDNLSQDLLRGSAEIAGAVIRRAKEGHPVFTRLLEIDPEIQNGARAYFNRELFGRDKVPSVDGLKKFLLENEGVLNQLGLYDEFSTISNARASGERALNSVKTELTQAKTSLKEATAAERAQQKAVTAAERLRSAASKRLGEAEKAAVTPEEVIKESELRAKGAEAKLSKRETAIEKETSKAVGELRSEAGKSLSKVEKAGSKVREIEQAVERLNIADPKDAVSEAKRIVEGFSKDLTTEQYGDLIRQIKMVEDTYGKTEAARQKLKTIISAGVGVGVLGGSAASAGRWIINKMDVSDY